MSYGRWVVLLMIGVQVVAIAGCTKANPLDCSDGTCSDKAHPYCDKDGTVGGTPNTCIAVSCSAANAFVACNGDTAVSCNAAGDGYDLTPCTMGCSADAHGCNMCMPNATYCTTAGVQACGSDGAPTTFESCAQGCLTDPQPHCAHLAPRYLASVCDSPATTDFDQTTDATLGTDLDSSCTGGIVQQAAAPDICVVRNKTITIDASATLKVTGGRLLALVADDSLAIHGALDASADGGTSGPGGGTQTSGGGAQNLTGNGGGGAGFKTAGGAGASHTADGGGANGGAAVSDPAQLAVMVGGPRNSGGGGGGVILIACRGAVSVDGLIDVGGGGGAGGYRNPNTGVVFNASGAGAGGYLVMQGWSVAVTGRVYANGGGGGAGYSSPGGATGADGGRSSSVGAAGGVPQGTAGHGGTGACVMASAGGGAVDTGGAAGGAGGGGGGMGYLQTYTPTGVAPTITPTDTSPDFQPNLTVQTN